MSICRTNCKENDIPKVDQTNGAGTDSNLCSPIALLIEAIGSCGLSHVDVGITLCKIIEQANQFLQNPYIRNIVQKQDEGLGLLGTLINIWIRTSPSFMFHFVCEQKNIPNININATSCIEADCKTWGYFRKQINSNPTGLTSAASVYRLVCAKGSQSVSVNQSLYVAVSSWDPEARIYTLPRDWRNRIPNPNKKPLAILVREAARNINHTLNVIKAECAGDKYCFTIQDQYSAVNNYKICVNQNTTIPMSLGGNYRVSRMTITNCRQLKLFEEKCCPSPTPTPSPTSTSTPTPTPTSTIPSTPTPTPSATSAVTPTPTPTTTSVDQPPTPTPTPTPTFIPDPTPTPTPTGMDDGGYGYYSSVSIVHNIP